MSCQRCQSERLISTSACVKDTCYLNLNKQSFYGYVPGDIGMGGGGDEMDWSYCLNCGQIQGEFPLPLSQFERYAKDYPAQRTIEPMHIYQKGYLTSKEQAYEDKYKAEHNGKSAYGVEG